MHGSVVGAGLARAVQPRAHAPVNVIEALQQARHHHFGRQVLFGHGTERRRHFGRVPDVIVQQYIGEPELLGFQRADALLKARLLARDDQRPFVERKNFAERIVTAHGDNAGGMAEMAHCDPEVRKRTDALDATGNTTAAIGKGFAIGSAALTALALFNAFTLKANVTMNLDNPTVTIGILIGGMLPFLFSAFAMSAVGKAAKDMVDEVR
ncbi:MAG: putative K(+)-stimulated pyrophosphate-energized sodium pump, partial [Alphaproteobacteria bacterium MarineAlpha10_Bin1]